MPEEEERRKRLIRESRTDFVRWSDPGSLEATWEVRSVRAADRIPCGARVLDMGCGAMTLEKHLPAGCKYVPCDLVKRDERTIVCNFNDGNVPDEINDADRVVLLGVLEYIYDLPKFLSRLATAGKIVVASYCATDFTGPIDRAALGWVNNFSTGELRSLFANAKLTIRSFDRIDSLQALFVLDRATVAKEPKNVLILSCANCGNFGDRFGFHLINSVLPSHSTTWNAYLTPWSTVSGNIDLLVVGTGNSLYKPLLTNELLALIRRAKRSIGIFGTQYREQFTAGQARQVICALDMWFARYEEDLLLYGSGIANAVHLGDWLVDAFPITEASDNSVLSVGKEIWDELPLDRVIQKIQMYKTVKSTRLHPLLCALASARQVAYVEQREMGGDSISGKFRSMLLDVFGKSFPEMQYWDVDREAVRAYKKKVRGNMEVLKKCIADMLD